jgi:TIR domain
MEYKYQLIILGTKSKFADDILDIFWQRIEELGLLRDKFLIINELNFVSTYSGNCPAFCLYFGDETGSHKNITETEKLLKDATLILPIVNNLRKFTFQIPAILKGVNGLELTKFEEIEKMISVVLQGFSLLRISRRIFISYKRDESSSIAIQLFEELEKNGFDVFLDTHSIRPAEPFQEELWQRMADTDVVLLLNTPGFLKSHWTTEELAKANSMSIGILQLIWPSHNIERDAELTIPMQLHSSDFGNTKYKDENSYLSENTILKIVSSVESLRARSLASRQDNLITEFMSVANTLGKKVDLQPDRFISGLDKNNDGIVIIPAVGVPHAFTYNQSEELISKIDSRKNSKIYLLYDQRNIREKWINHLMWLDNYLPIKTIKVTECKIWLNNN